MISSLLVLLFVTFVAGVFIKLIKVRSFWADRGVPYDPPHPILGSLTFFLKENPAQWIRKLYNRHNSPYVGIWLFWRPALVINTPELARRILVKDFDVFRNRLLGSGNAKSDPIGGLNIFTVNDPFWSLMRRRLTPLFTSSKLKSLHELYATKAKHLCQRIKSDLQNNQTLEVRSLYTDYTTDVITVAAFGIESNAVLTGESTIRTVTKQLMEYSHYRGLAWCCIFFLPEVVSFFRFTLFPRKSMDILRKVYQTVVTNRGGYNNISKHNDMIDFLRTYKYEAIQKGEDLPDDALIAQASILLQGAFDTTANALTFATCELAFNSEVQDRLYKELSEAKQKIGDKDFDGDVLAELPYLNACIKETLRKYAPMGWLDRVAERDYQIDDKLTIPAGTTVYVNSIGMQFDPKYYPDPDKYFPDRFLPENEENIPAFTYMPFGAGPRNCIGLRFAQRSLRYGLATVVMDFKLQQRPGFKNPSDIEIEKKGLFLMPGEPCYVDFIPRK